MFDIITDSACDLTLDTAKQLQIEVVPFYVSLDGEHYRKEGKEIAVRDFYQFMVDNPSAYPKTSLASIEDFEQAFRAHAAAGRDVLCLVFTSKMSGCVGSARNARDLVLEDFPDARIEVIDSAAATVTESTMVENAVAMRDAGCTLDETVTWLEAEKATNQIFFTVGNLDYLIKGGRIGKVTGRAANMLGIKPMILFKDGEIFSGGVARGRQKSFEKALEQSSPRPDAMGYDINYYLATAYYRNGQVDKAIHVYQAITDLKPGEKTAWYLKGTMELEQGSTDAAKADFDKAVEAAPNDYDIRIDIFCSCSKYGQDDLGKSYLENVLDGDRKRISDFDLGRISYYLGDYEQARTSLEKAQENGGAEAASLLGQTYEALGDYNYAASVYNTYLQNKTPDASLYNQLGLCKLKGGDYEAALAAFQAGLEVEGNTATQSLMFNELVAYEYLGQYDKAKLAMDQYLALYPDDEKAQREAVFLQTR